MKSIRIPVLLLLLAGVLLLMGGCYRHYVDVYINNECILVTMDNGVIETLLVFKGDFVVFNNLNEESESSGPTYVDLHLPEGMFDESEVSDLRTDENAIRVQPGKRVILEVISDGPIEGLISITGDCPTGTPKVKVGEEP